MADHASTDEITLNVVIEDDDPNRRAIEITVPLRVKFTKVASVIREVYWVEHTTSISSLELYKANIPPEQVEHAQLLDEAFLPLMKRVASEWPSSSDVDDDLIHIIVRPKCKCLFLVISCSYNDLVNLLMPVVSPANRGSPQVHRSSGRQDRI